METTEASEQKPKRLSPAVKAEIQAFGENNALLADISHYCDQASRNRRLKDEGLSATEVYAEVTADILQRITTGLTWQAIVDGLLEHADEDIKKDTTSEAAHGLAIGKLAAAAAMRLKRQYEKEKPVGDSSAVMGEEVATEQRSLTEQEATRGNDRQMAAVMSRKARHGGLHRADVHAVADWSRSAMRDSATRYFHDTEDVVTAALFDANREVWFPEAERQAEAFDLVFASSVADTLFGLGQNVVDVEQALRGILTMRAFGLKAEQDDSGLPNDYPRHWPYKPLSITESRTPKPKVVLLEHEKKCGQCGHLHPENPWEKDRQKGMARVKAEEAAKAAADPKYKPKAYKSAYSATHCPRGKVTQWRSLETKCLLPAGLDSPSMANALRKGLKNFARWVERQRSQYWNDQAATQVYLGQYRSYVEQWHGVGEGVPTSVPVAMLPDRQGQPWRSVFDNSDVSAKEARRFALMTGLSGQDLHGSFGIEQEPFLPGVKRQVETQLDMLHGAIKVSHNGNMVVDGERGTFVFGIPELLDWTANLNLGRKVVAELMLLGRLTLAFVVETD